MAFYQTECISCNYSIMFHPAKLCVPVILLAVNSLSVELANGVQVYTTTS